MVRADILSVCIIWMDGRLFLRWRSSRKTDRDRESGKRGLGTARTERLGRIRKICSCFCSGIFDCGRVRKGWGKNL